MSSGAWMIIIQADNVNLAVERTFTLTVGVPQTTVITVSLSMSPSPGAKTGEGGLTIL
jgi:hypothetical protein